MNSKKDISINTSAFSITIHWNGQIVSTQLCILAGIILLKWVSHNKDVNTLCTVLLILDVISILVVLFMGSSIGTDGDTEKKDEKKEDKQEDAGTVEPATKESKSSGKHSSEQQKDRTIKKKVPMPAQQGFKRPDVAKPPEPAPEPEPVKEEHKQETVSVGEMSEQELNDLFNF